MIFLIHYKNYCKWHDVPPPRTTVKEKEEKHWTRNEKKMSESICWTYLNDAVGKVLS
jgi:hypothetical protein